MGTNKYTDSRRELRYDSFTASNSIGPGHEDNQDSFLADPERGLFAVADGLGGYEGGKIASKMAVDSLAAVNWKMGGGEQSVFREALLEIHYAIIRKAENLGYFRMGTTISAVQLTGSEKREAVVANVGDSPILLLRDGRITALYHDDSHRELGDVYSITQCLGCGKEPDVHTKTVGLLAGDTILICSDGITDNLARKGDYSMLLGALNGGSARAIVDAAISTGFKKDDMTAVLVLVR